MILKCDVCNRSPLTLVGLGWSAWMIWHPAQYGSWRGMLLCVLTMAFVALLNHALHNTFGWFQGGKDV